MSTSRIASVHYTSSYAKLVLLDPALYDVTIQLMVSLFCLWCVQPGSISWEKEQKYVVKPVNIHTPVIRYCRLNS